MKLSQQDYNSLVEKLAAEILEGASFEKEAAKKQTVAGRDVVRRLADPTYGNAALIEEQMGGYSKPPKLPFKETKVNTSLDNAVDAAKEKIINVADNAKQKATGAAAKAGGAAAKAGGAVKSAPGKAWRYTKGAPRKIYDVFKNTDAQPFKTQARIAPIKKYGPGAGLALGAAGLAGAGYAGYKAYKKNKGEDVAKAAYDLWEEAAIYKQAAEEVYAEAELYKDAAELALAQLGYTLE